MHYTNAHANHLLLISISLQYCYKSFLYMTILLYLQQYLIHQYQTAIVTALLKDIDILHIVENLVILSDTIYYLATHMTYALCYILEMSIHLHQVLTLQHHNQVIFLYMTNFLLPLACVQTTYKCQLLLYKMNLYHNDL